MRSPRVLAAGKGGEQPMTLGGLCGGIGHPANPEKMTDFGPGQPDGRFSESIRNSLSLCLREKHVGSQFAKRPSRPFW